MPEIETPESAVGETSDMSPEEFAEVSERALVALLGADAAADYVTFIRANRTDVPAVSSYLLSAAMYHEFDVAAFKAKVNEILESDQETE